MRRAYVVSLAELRDLAGSHCGVRIVLISGLSGNALQSGELLGARHGHNIIGAMRKPLSLHALADLLASTQSLSSSASKKEPSLASFDPVFCVDAARCSVAGMRVRLARLNGGKLT